MQRQQEHSRPRCGKHNHMVRLLSCDRVGRRTGPFQQRQASGEALRPCRQLSRRMARLAQARSHTKGSNYLLLRCRQNPLRCPGSFTSSCVSAGRRARRFLIAGQARSSNRTQYNAAAAPTTTARITSGCSMVPYFIRMPRHVHNSLISKLIMMFTLKPVGSQIELVFCMCGNHSLAE